MPRTEVDVTALPAPGGYQLVNCCVIPRPIAWVSTISAAGVRNVAPHSFFSVASADPPIVMFTSIGVKDTLTNVREVPELVVNIVTRDLALRVNDTSCNFPGEVDEFDEVAGVTAEPSRLVTPARVAESPIALECRVVGFHELPRSTVVFAEVLLAAFDPAVVADDGLPDAALVDPVTRMGRMEWGGLGEVFSLERPSWRAWQQRR